MSKSAKKFVPVPPPKVVGDAGKRPPEEIFEQQPEPEESINLIVSENSQEIKGDCMLPEPVVKVKKPRSQKQLDHLERIRQKSIASRQAKAEAKRRNVSYAPTPAQEIPTAPIPIPEPQQVVSAPIPVQNNYLSAEQIQNIVRETMTHTLNDYSQKALARQTAQAEETNKKVMDLAKQEADLRQKKLQQNLLRRPRKTGRF